MARERSSCPPPSPNLVRTHLIENYQALRDIAPCLSRAAILPKATKLELGRGAHLKTPSSANHTAAASQPTGRIAKAASWLHLSRVSPALHLPERPSHTHTPKPDFGGRGHEVAPRRSNTFHVCSPPLSLLTIIAAVILIIPILLWMVDRLLIDTARAFKYLYEYILVFFFSLFVLFFFPQQ